MLYTCSDSAVRKVAKMRRYCIAPGHGNKSVEPDRQDLDLYRRGVMTDKGFALNYEMKLRGQEAYEWMERVSAEAIHGDVALVGEEKAGEKKYRMILAETMASMFGGKMNFRYIGELE